MSLLIQVVGCLPRSWLKAQAAIRSRGDHAWFNWVFDWATSHFKHRDGVITRGVGRGLKFNAGDSNAGYLLGITEPETQAAFAALLRPGMTVYDVGANVGFLSMIAARLVGPQGCVVCFEPVPATACQILYNAALNGFTHLFVREEALGREDGQARFLVSAAPTLSRCAAVGHPGQEVGELTVRVRRLDTVTADTGLPKPDLIKIDVEGAEVDVLAGASHTLATAPRPLLLIELHGTNEAVARTLAELHYSVLVLGSRVSVMDPRAWHVIGVPHERTDLTSVLASLTEPSLRETDEDCPVS